MNARQSESAAGTRRCSPAAVDEPLDVWFKREILAHERALMRYLTRIWRDHEEVLDLRQETYVRVYAAAQRSRPSRPKSFLFSAARHLMTDHIRRRRIVAIDAVGDLEALNVPVEEGSPEARATVHEELQRLAQALDSLPAKCREVIWLRRVDDLPQKEVAARLHITQKTVEKHVAKGMKLLAQALFQPMTEKTVEPDARVSDDERIHGQP